MNLFVRERERAKGILGSYEAWKGKRPDQTLMFSWRQPKFPIFTMNYILCISPFVISFIILKNKKSRTNYTCYCVHAIMITIEVGGLWVCNFIFINFKVCTCGVLLFLYSSDYWGWSLLIVPRARTSSPSMGKCFHVSIVCSSATGCLPSFYW